MFNMNDIYARLANGEKIEDIGNEIATMMNQAIAKHEAETRAAEEAKRAEAAQAEKEAAKRELVEEMCEIMKELAILEGIDPDEIEITSDMVDQLMEGITASFQLARHLEKMFAAAPTHAPVKASKIAPSDEQILADFIKMFN
jgi:arginyl-tRNA synthetase